MSTRMSDAVDKGRGETVGDGSGTLRTVPNPVYYGFFLIFLLKKRSESSKLYSKCFD